MCGHKQQVRSLARPVCSLVLIVCWLAAGGLRDRAFANTASTASSTNEPSLDERRVFALGMIESGNDDNGVGRYGEVSRYQIHPSVWKAYSRSQQYQNPDVAVLVARQHWGYLADYFREKAGRAPSDFDMYVLWNTRFGYYARQGFDPERVHPVIRDRAGRFVNLVNR